MPNATRDERRPGGNRRRLVRAMRTFAGELELYIGAASRGGHMHRTDLTGLAAVMDQQADGVTMTPGRLSESLGLSAPATSAMIDRLEAAGHLRRTPHPTDRRSTVLELTTRAWSTGGQMFARLGDRLEPLFDDYTEDQLELIAHFLDRAGAQAHLARGEVGSVGGSS